MSLEIFSVVKPDKLMALELCTESPKVVTAISNNMLERENVYSTKTDNIFLCFKQPPRFGVTPITAERGIIHKTGKYIT